MTLLSNGRVGIGITNPNGLLSLFSSNQLLPRLILSGQEFFQAGNTSTEGIALLCGVNRAGNRQLWIGDSANLAQNSTTSLLRLTTTNIDCISTNGLSAMPITIGNSGGINMAGNVNIINNSKLIFNNNIDDMRIQLWEGYGFSINGGTLRYNTMGNHTFFINGGEIIRFNSVGMGFGNTNPQSYMHLGNVDLAGSSPVLLFGKRLWNSSGFRTAFIGYNDAFIFVLEMLEMLIVQ